MTINFISTIANCQTEKYTKFIGGTIAGNFRTENYWALWFNLEPTYGKFVFDNIAIGFKLPINATFTRDYNNYTFGVSPFVRKYFKTKTKFKPFANLTVGYDNYVYRQRNPLIGYNYEGNEYLYGLGVGFNYYFNKSVGLITNIEYTQNNNFKSKYIYNKGNGYVRLKIGVEILFPFKLKKESTSN